MIQKTSSPYAILARYYDRMMDYVEYDRWARYILEIIHRNKLNTSRVLDVGTGTGNLPTYLPFPVIGLDLNRSMLKENRIKNPKQLLINDHMPGLESIRHQSFTGIMIMYDSINYIRQEEWTYLLNRLFEILLPGGWVLFDVVTQFCCMQYFNDEVFQEEFEDGFFIRKTHFDNQNCIQTNVFHFHTDAGDYKETHRQYIPTVKWINNRIQESPLQLAVAYHEQTFKEVQAESLRVHFLLKKETTG